MAKKWRCRPPSKTCLSPSAGYSKRGRCGGTRAKAEAPGEVGLKLVLLDIPADSPERAFFYRGSEVGESDGPEHLAPQANTGIGVNPDYPGPTAGRSA